MSTTVRATGHHPADPPTITVSGGKGNTPSPEIHIQMRDGSEDQSRTIAAWFSRDQLLDAVTDADAVSRVSEPAVSE